MFFPLTGRFQVSCPGRGAAFFTLLRRAGTYKFALPWTPDQQRTTPQERRAAQHPERQSLRYRADHLGDPLDDLADLILADDQRRGQREAVTGDAQHHLVVVERAVQRVEAALAGQVRT